jgi:hypothetical protein
MKFGISYQGLVSRRIYIGRLNKAQTAYLDGKEDHTEQAVLSVGEYVLAAMQGDMEISNGHKRLRIRVEEVNGQVTR